MPRSARNVVQRTVVSVEPIGGHRLRLRFDDGVEGVIDVRDYGPLRRALAPLAAPEYVAKAGVDETGALAWPNGVDFCPVLLYSDVTGRPLPRLDEAAGRGRPKRRTRPA